MIEGHKVDKFPPIPSHDTSPFGKARQCLNTVKLADLGVYDKSQAFFVKSHGFFLFLRYYSQPPRDG
jgi:hypothetical protein